MTDEKLAETIMMYLEKHKGRQKAIARKELLTMLLPYMPEEEKMETKDRRMRRIYEKLPIVSCAEGLFIPIRAEEIEGFKLYLRAKAIPLFNRFNLVASAYPNLIPEKGMQLDLFQ